MPILTLPILIDDESFEGDVHELTLDERFPPLAAAAPVRDGHLVLMNTLPGPDDVLDMDELVVQSARASTMDDEPIGQRMGLRGNPFLSETPGIQPPDERLLRYLLNADPKHVSPMSQAIFRFHVRLPIVIRSQWQRHWSWALVTKEEFEGEYEVEPEPLPMNERSGRYQEYQERVFHPTWRSQDGKNKQGGGEPLPKDVQDKANLIYERAVREALSAYQELLDLGVARDQARFPLPGFAMMTEMYALVSARNLLLSFIPQRDHHGAQRDFIPYARAMRAIARLFMPKASELLWGQA